MIATSVQVFRSKDINETKLNSDWVWFGSEPTLRAPVRASGSNRPSLVCRYMFSLQNSFSRLDLVPNWLDFYHAVTNLKVHDISI